MGLGEAHHGGHTHTHTTHRPLTNAETNLSKDEAAVKRVADQAFLDGGDRGRPTAKMTCQPNRKSCLLSNI